MTNQAGNQSQDPKQQEPQPPFPNQQQQGPGIEAEMQPRPDFGEQSYRGSGKLSGRAALITGADSGIGRAVALAFAREGADVLISYFDEEQDAQETARWVREAGRKAVLMPGDIADEAHCQALVQRVMDEFGHLDILVNNAAFQILHQNINEVPSDEFVRTFQINLFSMFYLSKAAAAHMKPGSSIINTASIEAFQPKPELLAYASSKGAIVTFTEALSQMLIKQGIRVNAVAPGPVWTPLIPSSMPPEQVAQFGKNNPMKRPAQPLELAPVYVLLASQEASYINGEIYGVTGGKPLF